MLNVPSDSERNSWNLFLQRFIAKNGEDKLIVVNHSVWLKELLSLEKKYDDIHLKRKISSIVTLILNNPIFCTRFENAAELPEHIDKLLYDRTINDRFLFEASAHTNDKIIITTDKKLIARFSQQSEFRVVHLDAFLASY